MTVSGTEEEDEEAGKEKVRLEMEEEKVGEVREKRKGEKVSRNGDVLDVWVTVAD